MITELETGIDLTGVKLERPIIFFDLETTGTDVKKDRIIELYAAKYNLDGSVTKYYSLFCPEIDIHPKATEAHGFTKERLASEPTFAEKAHEIYHFFKDCDLGGYNILKFDVPLLMEELFRYKYPYNPLTVNIIDPFNILYKYEPRTLSHVYKNMCGKEMVNAHSAEADINATIEIFKKQIDVYGLPKDINEISKIVRTDKNGSSILDFSGLFSIKENEYYYNIGKHKDKKVMEHMDYLEWVIQKSTFSENTKFTAYKIQKEILERSK